MGNELRPGEHDWVGGDDLGDGYSAETYCRWCLHERDFEIAEDDEPPCPDNPIPPPTAPATF